MSVYWTRQHSVRWEDVDPSRFSEERLEIWHGELVPMSPSDRFPADLGGELFAILREFARGRKGLRAAADGAGFLLSREPDVLFSPDASLFRLREQKKGPWHLFAPEVAVEVRSPSDSWAQLLVKRDQYLHHGAEQVWLVDPKRHVFEIHFADGRTLVASEGIIVCEGIVEGLIVDLDELFDNNPFADEDE